MIEIMKEHVAMPPISERRYVKDCINGNINGKWVVIDRQNDNRIRYKGEWKEVVVACHILNKKHYLDHPISTEFTTE